MQNQEVSLKEYKSHKFSLSFNREAAYVFMEVEGFMEGTAFRNNTLKMLKLLTDNKATKVLVNARNMKLIRVEDAEWLVNSFLPQAILQGFEACSFIKPEDYHARLSIENVIYKIPASLFNAAWFDLKEDAEEWLNGIGGA